MKVEDGETAWNQIFADWILANIILEVGEAYDAYYENPNKETAAALVDVYERVFLDEEFFTEEEFEVLYAFFYDIDDLYDAAKDLLAGDKPDGATTEGSDKSDKDTSPETGDDFNAAPYAALMAIAAAVAGLAVKRRRVQ